MAYKVKVSGSGSVIRTYACNSAGTGEEHEFEVKLKSGEHPKFCPVCGYAVDQRSKPRPKKMSLGGSALARSVDRTYRSLEETSAQRAAAMNNPGLKITDMKDRLREGDVAAVMPHNSVTNFMDTANHHNIRYGWGGGSMGTPAFHNASPLPVPQNTWTGPGHVSLSAIQGESGRAHQMTRAQTQLAGQINKGKP